MITWLQPILWRKMSYELLYIKKPKTSAPFLFPAEYSCTGQIMHTQRLSSYWSLLQHHDEGRRFTRFVQQFKTYQRTLSSSEIIIAYHLVDNIRRWLFSLQWRHMTVVASQIISHSTAQQFIQANIKENINGPRYWLFVREIRWRPWSLLTKGQHSGKHHHVMTSSRIALFTNAAGAVFWWYEAMCLPDGSLSNNYGSNKHFTVNVVLKYMCYY